jgi:hypothetical protein
MSRGKYFSSPSSTEFQVDRAKDVIMRFPGNFGSRTLYSVAILLFCATIASAQTEGKVPSEVIDHVASHGSALVLVGLKVPWQMESQLSEEQVRLQRRAIAAIQRDLLTEINGKSFKIIRRYDTVPGIALQVGADALAELARSSNVSNVLLDRPAVVEEEGYSASEKVPQRLFKTAASKGTVLVLAGLKTPWQREDQLSAELVSLQRKAILTAQSYVLAELNGTQFNVLRLYRTIPGIALRVGLDALQVLQNSPAITNVLQDRPAGAAR